MTPATRFRGRTKEYWTPALVPGLSGVTAIVTGANSGLGLQTAIELARHGAQVVLACRNAERGGAALAQLRDAVPQARAELRELDVADLASVRRFASAWADRRLDLLVNNAGVMGTPHRVTPDGFELQLATNHLGHFALTGLLLPTMLISGTLLGGPPRVVSVSSSLHWIGRIHRDDLMMEHRYSSWPAYSRSKLANLLFMRELQRRADDAGARLASLAAHPGYADTNLQTSGPELASQALGLSGLNHRALVAWAVGTANRVVAQPAANGAWPILRAATDPRARSGEFFGPSGLAQLAGPPRRVGMSSAALDPELASWLWERSAELTGADYAALRLA